MLRVASLRTEHLDNPIGIDAENPRLSWIIISDDKNVIQKHYRVQASETDAFDRIIWDTGKVESDRSQGVRYRGRELKSMERIWWRVKVWSDKRSLSSASLLLRDGVTGQFRLGGKVDRTGEGSGP